MDFVSLSPSDDDLFRQHQDHHSSEADNFPVTSIPETPIPVAQKPSRKRARSKSTNSTSSMVRITPGSSLLNIQDYHSLPDDSFVSPPSAAKTGRGNSGTESRHRRSSLPATTATWFNRGSWHRDASTLFPSTTTARFNQNSWPRNASALNFLCAPCCTKRQLLSLLGHFKFTLRIIPQRWAFISNPLSIASSVPWLLTSISLGSSSRADIHPWLNLTPTGTESHSFTTINRLTRMTSICTSMLLLLSVLGVSMTEDGLQQNGPQSSQMNARSSEAWHLTQLPSQGRLGVDVQVVNPALIPLIGDSESSINNSLNPLFLLDSLEKLPLLSWPIQHNLSVVWSHHLDFFHYLRPFHQGS